MGKGEKVVAYKVTTLYCLSKKRGQKRKREMQNIQSTNRHCWTDSYPVIHNIHQNLLDVPP